MEDAQTLRTRRQTEASRAGESGLEKRRFARVKLALPGRFLDPEGGEHPCMTVDVAPGGVRVKTLLAPRPGSRIVAYIQELGRVEGVVVRTMSDEFALVVTGTPRKMERLLEKIAWILRRNVVGAASRRLLPRLEFDGVISIIVTYKGRQQSVEMLDISETGVAFRSDLPLRVADQIKVGTRRAVVARLFEGGAAAKLI